jgi:hypothetical protein
MAVNPQIDPAKTGPDLEGTSELSAMFMIRAARSPEQRK